jgi:hypothetical protein
MSNPKRPPTLQLVQPNLEEMERVLTESVQQLAPMIRRGPSVRQKMDAEVRALEAERATIVDRQQLAQRHHDALMKGFNLELDDIDDAVRLYTGGLTQDTLTNAG